MTARISYENASVAHFQGTPVMTKGLVGREINGVIKIFDIETGKEVIDIAVHQTEYPTRGVCFFFNRMGTLALKSYSTLTQLLLISYLIFTQF